MNSATANQEPLPAQAELKRPIVVGSGDLLDRVLMELLARRGSAEITAMERKRCGLQVEAVGWECRAAGLAEAIAVVKMFNDATRSNVES